MKYQKQEDIFNINNSKTKKTCNCGEVKGKTIILNNFAHVGVITEFQDNGVFKNNAACYLENNYCPQCGKKYQ